jgi:hypothetical protein
MTTNKNTIQIGTTFLSAYADGNCLWEVIAIDGEYATCQIDLGDLDYGGTVKAFLVDEIQRILAFSDSWNNLFDENDARWDATEIGDVLHYHNAFGAFVRGVVGLTPEGDKGLVPTDLVSVARKGNDDGSWGWKPYDLVTWMADGTISEGYHVRKINEGTAWRPGVGTIFEWSEREQRDWDDPRLAEPESLEAPERDAATIRQQQRVHAAGVVIAMLQDRDPNLEAALATLGEAVVALPPLVNV